jgi:hypothetical protein
MYRVVDFVPDFLLVSIPLPQCCDVVYSGGGVMLIAQRGNKEYKLLFDHQYQTRLRSVCMAIADRLRLLHSLGITERC